jgi:site-specific DNA-adenine methylase
MNFGIPYMGSKSKICEQVCRLFPNAENFYDLFGGGFSISHFMLKHRCKDFKQLHFNEIREGVCELVKDAINGKYNYDKFKPDWISSDEFKKRVNSDIFVKLIWSFGNNGKNYLFGKDIEFQKKSLHNAIVFNEFNEFATKIFGVSSFPNGFTIIQKRLHLKNRLRINGKGERLEQLERLQQLQQLERLERLEFYTGSYIDVPIKENSVIYCDIPYESTASYDKNNSFNRKEFLDWAANNKEAVFISEYQVKDERFKCISNFEKRSMLSSDKSNTLIKIEKVFVNEVGYKRIFDARKK